MAKTILTTIGDGNRFSDLSFLWFCGENSRRDVRGHDGHKRLAGEVGFRFLNFIANSEGPARIKEAFSEALLGPTPMPMAEDAVRCIMELSKGVSGISGRTRFAEEFLRWLSEGRGSSLADWQRIEDADFRSFDSEKLQGNLMSAFDTSAVIVESSPPTAETILALLSKGSGVALGAYLGFEASSSSPLFLFAAVPGGILICCTAAGIAEALQFGLRTRIIRYLTGFGPDTSDRESSVLLEQILGIGTVSPEEIASKGGDSEKRKKKDS